MVHFPGKQLHCSSLDCGIACQDDPCLWVSPVLVQTTLCEYVPPTPQSFCALKGVNWQTSQRLAVVQADRACAAQAAIA